MWPFVFRILVAVFLFWPEQPHGSGTANAQERVENNTAAQTERHKSFWQRTTDDPVALYTLVLSLFTGLLVSVTGGLIWVGARQVGLTKNIADRQARDIEIIQRAYISVEPSGLVPHHDRNDRLMCAVTFYNVGHLPARNVRWFGDVWPKGLLAENSPPEDSRFDLLRHDGFPIGDLDEGSIVLPPGAKTTRHVATMFTYRFGNVGFVWGIVTYDDGFGRSRYTKFCHRYGLKQFIGTMGFTIPGKDAFLHQFGNDAD